MTTGDHHAETTGDHHRLLPKSVETTDLIKFAKGWRKTKGSQVAICTLNSLSKVLLQVMATSYSWGQSLLEDREQFSRVSSSPRH